MDSQRKAGNTLLAISHNASLSDGWMYPTDLDSYGLPIDAAWRDRNERLVEIKQIRGRLVALGIGCWPRGDSRREFYVMLVWSVLAACSLAVVGLR
jgi:hypothetical protein